MHSTRAHPRWPILVAWLVVGALCTLFFVFCSVAFESDALMRVSLFTTGLPMLIAAPIGTLAQANIGPCGPANVQGWAMITVMLSAPLLNCLGCGVLHMLASRQLGPRAAFGVASGVFVLAGGGVLVLEAAGWL